MDERLGLADLPEVTSGVVEPPGTKTARNLEAVYDIPVTVSAVLGKSTA